MLLTRHSAGQNSHAAYGEVKHLPGNEPWQGISWQAYIFEQQLHARLQGCLKAQTAEQGGNCHGNLHEHLYIF